MRVSIRHEILTLSARSKGSGDAQNGLIRLLREIRELAMTEMGKVIPTIIKQKENCTLFTFAHQSVNYLVWTLHD